MRVWLKGVDVPLAHASNLDCVLDDVLNVDVVKTPAGPCGRRRRLGQCRCLHREGTAPHRVPRHRGYQERAQAVIGLSYNAEVVHARVRSQRDYQGQQWMFVMLTAGMLGGATGRPNVV